MRTFIGTFFLTSVLITPLLGTTYIVQSPEEAVRHSSLVVEGIVKEIQYQYNRELGMGEAWVTFDVLETIVGVCPAQITIRRIGVDTNLDFSCMEWYPSYAPGEHLIQCLLSTPYGYSTVGLYNGKFVIDHDYVRGTNMPLSTLKHQIRLVSRGELSAFSIELPSLQPGPHQSSVVTNGQNAPLSGGGFLNGGFLTWNFTWDPSYVPVQMHYNGLFAPDGSPNASSIAYFARMAYDLWSDPNSFFTYQNGNPFTTTAILNRDNFSLMMWGYIPSGNVLMITTPYPNDVDAGIFYGPNSNQGIDIAMNNYIAGTWYFASNPPSTFNVDQIDFVDVLAHELGHGLGLQHVPNTNSIMHNPYTERTGLVRGQSDGDLAGRVYQHTSQNVSGAVTHSIVLSANRTSISVPYSLALPNGCTFGVDPGKTLTFGQGATIQVPGPVLMNGSSASHIVLDGQGYSRGSVSSALIVIPSNGSGNIQYCDFKNAGYELTLTGITGGISVRNCNFTNFGYSADSRAIYLSSPIGSVSISNNMISGSNSTGTAIYAYSTSSNVRIDSNSISSAGTGIRCYSSYASLKRNVISGNSSYGIQCDNVSSNAQYDTNDVRSSGIGISLNASSPFLMRNIVIQNGLNVLANGGSPNFGVPAVPHRGNNTIAYAGSPLLRAQNYASVYMGYTSQGGYNSIFETDLPHLRVLNYSSVYADNNYWGEGAGSYYCDGTSLATVANPLSSNPNHDPLAKIAAIASGNWNSSSDTSGESMYRAAMDKVLSGNLAEGKTLLEQIIGSQASKYAPLSLRAYYDLCTGQWGLPADFAQYRTDLYSMLGGFVAQPVATLLRPFALRLLAWDAALSRNEKQANSYLMQILGDYANSVHELAAMYDLIVSSVEVENNVDVARDLLTKMEASHPDELLTSMARVELGEKVDFWSLEKRDALVTSDVPGTFSLEAPYPNPFNPSTTIYYQVPVDSKVKIIIFDILGRQVQTLVDETKEIGFHSVKFGASQIASGPYFCRMVAEPVNGGKAYAAVRKLMVLK